MPIADVYGVLALFAIAITAGFLIRAFLLRETVRPERVVNNWRPKRQWVNQVSGSARQLESVTMRNR